MSWEPVHYTAAGTELTAYSRGTGAPVVLLHGSGLDDHQAFDGLAAALADDYLVLAVDVRGYGRSRCAEPQLHTWDQYAADVVALLDHLALRGAAVGGYSLGAGIALAAAIRYPDRVAALMLGWPAYAGRDHGLTPRQHVAWDEARAQVVSVRRVGLRATINGTEDSMLLDPLTEQRLSNQDEASLLAALEGELATEQPFHSQKQLAAIAVPTLIIPGLDDAHDPLIAELYARCIPQARTAPAAPIVPFGDSARVKGFLDEVQDSDRM